MSSWLFSGVPWRRRRRQTGRIATTLLHHRRTQKRALVHVTCSPRLRYHLSCTYRLLSKTKKSKETHHKCPCWNAGSWGICVFFCAALDAFGACVQVQNGGSSKECVLEGQESLLKTGNNKTKMSTLISVGAFFYSGMHASCVLHFWKTTWVGRIIVIIPSWWNEHTWWEEWSEWMEFVLKWKGVFFKE